jgi:hypothetical protein
MANQFGLRCPICGNVNLLDVEVRVWTTVNGDHVLDPYDRSKTAHEPFEGWQWAGDDKAHCPQCDHLGTVDDFKED